MLRFKNEYRKCSDKKMKLSSKNDSKFGTKSYQNKQAGRSVVSIAVVVSVLLILSGIIFRNYFWNKEERFKYMSDQVEGKKKEVKEIKIDFSDDNKEDTYLNDKQSLSHAEKTQKNKKSEILSSEKSLKPDSKKGNKKNEGEEKLSSSSPDFIEFEYYRGKLTYQPFPKEAEEFDDACLSELVIEDGLKRAVVSVDEKGGLEISAYDVKHANSIASKAGKKQEIEHIYRNDSTLNILKIDGIINNEQPAESVIHSIIADTQTSFCHTTIQNTKQGKNRTDYEINTKAHLRNEEKQKIEVYFEREESGKRYQFIRISTHIPMKRQLKKIKILNGEHIEKKEKKDLTTDLKIDFVYRSKLPVNEQ